MKNFRWPSMLFAMAVVALAATVPTARAESNSSSTECFKAGTAAAPSTPVSTAQSSILNPRLPKLQRELQNATGTIPIAVSVTADPAGDQAIRVIRQSALDPVTTSVVIRGQKIVHCSVAASALVDIAQLPAVVWIEKVATRKLLDERQDLILAGQIEPLAPHGAFLGSGYLNFLINNVGGGLASFMDPATYPIVDVADSGVGAAFGSGYSPITPCQLAFYKFGDLAQESRLIYVQAASVGSPDSTIFWGCVSSNGLLYSDLTDLTDVNGHGTRVASIIAGYNTHSPDIGGFQEGLGVSPFGTIGSTKIFGNGSYIYDFYGFISTNANGFAYDLNCVSYRFISSPSQFLPIPVSQLLQLAYRNRARIINNSWGDNLDFSGPGGSCLNCGMYSPDSMTYDIGVRDALLNLSPSTPGPSPLNQEMIVVFANGDNGSSGNVGGFADGMVASPATAKNVISVGATDNVRLDGSGCMVNADQSDSYHLSKSSSFGPTIDGRFKPEIVAPGSSVYALDVTYPNWVTNTYIYYGGTITSNSILNRTIASSYVCTPADVYNCYPNQQNNNVSSFAAPAVSGAIQLLWWYFQNRLGMLQPSPAMAKAYLCNSARYLPITDPRTGALDTLPSIGQGMGMLDLARMFDGVPRVLRDESTPRAIDLPLLTTNPAVQQTFFSKTRQTYKVSGPVYDSTKPFRVTLAWTDAPGSPTASTQLVNNLDLQVSVNGKSYKGNVFSGDHSIADPYAGFDSLNNMESVFLPAGQTGTWTVVVSASNLGGEGVPNINSSGGLDVISNQDFALVVYNADPSLASDASTLTTNDSCQSAIEITEFPVTFSNRLTRALYHNTHPSPSIGPGGIKEFFKISLPSAGTVFSADTFGSDFDTMLSVWQVQVLPQTVYVRGDCGALEELVANNNAASNYKSQCGTVYNQPQTLQSAVTWTADGNHSYYIIVEPFNDILLTNSNHLVLHTCATLPPIRLVSPTTGKMVLSNDFGSVNVGNISRGYSVALTNGTPSSLVVTSVSLQGSNANDFVIQENVCSGRLPGQSSCPILLAFQPQTYQPPFTNRSAQLVVEYEGTGSPQILELTGRALPPVSVDCFSLSNGLITKEINNSGSITFGATATGQTSVWQSLIINNCGTSDLIIYSVGISGINSNNFIVRQTCTNTIPRSTSCAVNVAFMPATIGDSEAQLTIIDNTTAKTNSFLLYGTGILPAPLVCLSPATLDFSYVEVNTTSNLSLIVSNCGTADLVFSSPAITGDSAFSVTSIPTSLAMGSNGTIMVQFAPTKCASATAVLQIVDNAQNSPQLVTLTGIGKGSQADLAISRTRTWNLKNLNKQGYGHFSPPENIFSNSTLTVTGARGKKLVFYLPIWNAGTWKDAFLIHGDGSTIGTYTDRLGTGTYTNKVSYFLGALPKDSVDITSAVTAGTYSTAALDTGAYTGLATMLRLEITVDKHAPPGISPITVKATPATKIYRSQSDSVQLKLTVK